MSRRMVVLLAGALLLTACSSPQETPAPGTPSRPEPSGIAPEALAHAGEEHGLHNLAEVAPGLFRGAQPEGEASFRYLASLGVKTILSVDGAQPDVEGAAKHGIRYVHVPIEYAGITADEQVRIARVAQLYGHDGLYVHCHHGAHRGPAALGVIWMTRDGISHETVVADLKKAGTDPKYRGLYEVARTFQCPPQESLDRITAADLPSRAPVKDMISAMVDIDASFVRLRNAKKNEWRVSPDHPDVNPPHEARILAERFRELGRTEDAAGRPEPFRNWLVASEEAAWALEKSIEAGDVPAASRHMDVIGRSCSDCHDRYRNNW